MNLAVTDGSGLGTSVEQPQSTTTPNDRRKPWDQQLAIPRSATRLRWECVDNFGRPVTWSDAQDAFEDYLWKQRDFANAEWVDFDHSYTRRHCEQLCGELCGVDRYIQQEFDDLHTVILTLRGNQYNANGGFRCPIDHYDELLQPNNSVRDTLNYHLDNPHARLTVLGEQKHGYAHVHWFFWTEGRPDREPFMRALHAHLRNSPIALETEHPTDDPDRETISIEPADPDPQFDHSGNDVPVTRLVHEAACQLSWPEYDMLDADPREKRFATLLWAKHYAKQFRRDKTYRTIRDELQTAWAEAQSDADDESESDDGVDYEDFEDAENPTVAVEAGAWDTDLDPVEHD